MATQTQRAQTNSKVPKRPSAAKLSAKQMSNGKLQPVQQRQMVAQKKAASVAGENTTSGVTSAYAIMAGRLANRVAELAEGITFVERSVWCVF